MNALRVNNLIHILYINLSVIELCQFTGWILPRFCFHRSLSIAGNCRMCLIELFNISKPASACVLGSLNNMKIFLNTPLTKKSRENILEILLNNHPLDCPICDQAGECDLQDQVSYFGINSTRFIFNKNSVEDKNFGPLIKTIMTRCIHCTRCIRFESELTGFETLGTLNRGTKSEINTYSNPFILSELSGNLIDLCPVGALSPKMYSFQSRSWEIRTIQSIDLNDGTGSNILLQIKEPEILRVLPRINSTINANLISNKVRFNFDFTKNKRSKYIYFLLVKIRRVDENEEFIYAKMLLSYALRFFKFKVINLGSRILFLVNNELDFISILRLEQMSIHTKQRIKVKNINIINTPKQENTFVNWIKDKLISLEKKSTLSIIFASNLRIESSIINNKLRSKFLEEKLPIYSFCSQYETLTNQSCIQYINLNVETIFLLLEGKDLFLSKLLIMAKNPIFCFGESMFLKGSKLSQIIFLIKKFKYSSIFLNIQLECNSESFSFLNIKSVNNKDFLKSDICVLINLNNKFFLTRYLSKFKGIIVDVNQSTKIYEQILPNTIFPISLSFEDENLYINMEGRMQKTDSTLKSKEFPSLHLLLTSFFLKKNAKYLVKNYWKFYRNILYDESCFLSYKSILSTYRLLSNKFFVNKFLLSNNIQNNILEDFYFSNFASQNSLIMQSSSLYARQSALKSNFVEHTLSYNDPKKLRDSLVKEKPNKEPTTGVDDGYPYDPYAIIRHEIAGGWIPEKGVDCILRKYSPILNEDEYDKLFDLLLDILKRHFSNKDLTSSRGGYFYAPYGIPGHKIGDVWTPKKGVDCIQRKYTPILNKDECDTLIDLVLERLKDYFSNK